MTTELEKQFFDTFGIECNIHFHQQFNGAQVSRGLEFYKEREKLEKEGIIKIWHKMLNPRPENDCIYWGEYHYPQITDRHYLELICAYNNFQNDTASFFIPFDYKNIKNNILTFLVEEINEKYKNRYFCNDVDKLKNQVQAIFEGER